MNTQNTFAADIKEMMNNWNELMTRATIEFPSDTDEERFDRVSKVMTKSLSQK